MTITTSTALVDTQSGATSVILGVTDDTGAQAFASIEITQGTGGWAKSYGGELSEEANDIDLAQGSGYYMAGYTGSFVAENYGVCHDIWIVKLLETGEIDWEKAFGTGAQEYGYALQTTSDGGCAVAGSSIHVYQAGAWIFKLDSSGNIDWHKLYKGSQFYPCAVQQTSDGDYWIGGNLYVQDIGNVSTVFKVDSSGNFAWTDDQDNGLKNVFDIADSNYNYINDLDQTSDGGCIVAGGVSIWYQDVQGYNEDMSVIKLDSSGDVLWQKTCGLYMVEEGGLTFNPRECANSIQQTSDNGYIIAGEIYGWGYGQGGGEEGEEINKAWIVKLTEDGDIEWQKSFGNPGYYIASSAQQTSDGGYIVSGQMLTLAAPYTYEGNVWIVKLDSTGVVEWQRNFGGSSEHRANSIVQTSDGGYIVAGQTSSFGSGYRGNAWVRKLNSDGSIGCALQQ